MRKVQSRRKSGGEESFGGKCRLIFGDSAARTDSAARNDETAEDASATVETLTLCRLSGVAAVKDENGQPSALCGTPELLSLVLLSVRMKFSQARDAVISAHNAAQPAQPRKKESGSSNASSQFDFEKCRNIRNQYSKSEFPSNQPPRDFTVMQKLVFAALQLSV